MVTLGTIISAIAILTLVSLLSVPLLMQVADNQTVATYNSINSTNQQLLGQQIYGKLNTSTLSGSGGFATNIVNTLGYAFIFPGIFQFMQAISRLPQVMFIDLDSVVAGTGLATLGTLNLTAIFGLFTVYIGLFIIIQGVSGWMKYSYWTS